MAARRNQMVRLMVRLGEDIALGKSRGPSEDGRPAERQGHLPAGARSADAGGGGGPEGVGNPPQREGNAGLQTWCSDRHRPPKESETAPRATKSRTADGAEARGRLAARLLAPDIWNGYVRVSRPSRAAMPVGGPHRENWPALRWRPRFTQVSSRPLFPTRHRGASQHRGKTDGSEPGGFAARLLAPAGLARARLFTTVPCGGLAAGVSPAARAMPL